MIEVKAADAPAGRPPLDVDAVVGFRQRGGRGASAAAVAPPPPAPMEAPASATNVTEAMPAFGAQPPPVSVEETAHMEAIREEPPVEEIRTPAPPPVGEVAPAESAPSSGRSAANWDAVVEELQGLADKALGARSRKVKDLLGSAERSQAGVESAVSQVSQISLLFVDSALLVKLEQDMRAQLQNYL
jgi:hypothetical protein